MTAMPSMPAVGLGSGGDHHHIEEVLAELSAQPAEVADLTVVDGSGQCHLDGEDAAIVASFAVIAGARRG